MARLAVCAIVLLAVAVTVSAENWAVLVAGSNGFWNYRHQADVCHANNILLEKGVPADHIIVFMFDDIANHTHNPIKGKLFNKPTPKGVPGKDVYARCQKDYTGYDVTPENFLAVLRGDAEAMKNIGSGKVLNSTADDLVFINFSDHGGTDIICFPGKDLHKDDLIDTFNFMYKKKKYKQLVFYLESCESGSMFDKVLPDNIDIYATTAANDNSSSWGWYCPGPDMGGDSVDGVHIKSCLGDFFSIKWMEDADSPRILNETLQEQFVYLKNATKERQTAMQFGDMSIASELVINFLGSGDVEYEKEDVEGEEQAPVTASGHGVRSADIKLDTLFALYHSVVPSTDGERARSADLAAQLVDEIELRVRVDKVFAKLTSMMTASKLHAHHMLTKPATYYPASARRTACYRHALETYREKCGRDDYSVNYLRVLSNMCADVAKTGASDHKLIRAIAHVCHA